MPLGTTRAFVGVAAVAALIGMAWGAGAQNWGESDPGAAVEAQTPPDLLTRENASIATSPSLQPLRRTGAPPRLLDASTLDAPNPDRARLATPRAETSSTVDPLSQPLRDAAPISAPPLAVDANAPRDVRANQRNAPVEIVDAPVELAALGQTSAPLPDRPRVEAFAASLAQVLLEAPRSISDFYAERNFEPIWTARPTAAQALIETLETADRHGLSPARYGVATLREGLAALGPDGAQNGDLAVSAIFEAALSRAYLDYARDVGFGLVSPRDVSREIDRDRPTPPSSAELLTRAAHATVSDDIVRHLETLPPQTSDYFGLVAALAEARAAPTLAPIEIVEILRPGMASPVVGDLRDRLYYWGDASSDVGFAAEADLYDAGLVDAVRAFQRRSGLHDDGLVGRNTIAALNAASQANAATIAVNLERARWMNRPLGQRRVVVNIPDLHAELIDQDGVLLRTRVVVGKAGKHETPEFSDEMSHVVVNPFWHVPYSIASEKLLKELQRDPSFAYSQRFEVFNRDGGWVDPWFVDWHGFNRRNFPFRLRQMPGHNNALGDVKFIFPNKHAVYLHDTPARELFNRSRRDFSHGCVRVADPTALAELLLSAQSPNPEKLYSRLRKRSGERHVALEDPVAVHLIYRTAWVDDDGMLQRRDDLYARDALVADALRRAGAEID